MAKDDKKVETAEDAPNLVTGFAVFIDDKGGVFLEKSSKIFNLPVEREATLLEVRRYMSEILMDIQAQASAEYTALRLSQISAPKK